MVESCSDSSCSRDCSKSTISLNYCSSLSNLNGFEDLWGRINCERGLALPNVNKGGYKLEISSNCSRTQQIVVGTGNCLRTTNQQSSTRFYCGVNKTLVEEQYWYKRDCTGLPDRIRELPFRLNGNCTNNLILRQCVPLIYTNEGFMGFWALPFISVILVYLYFIRLRLLAGFLQLITLQFSKALQSLLILDFFKNIIQIFIFNFTTFSRFISNLIVLLNIGTFTSMGSFLCIWYLLEDKCPNDSIYLSERPLYITFGFIIGFLTILLFFKSLSFCFSFQIVTRDYEDHPTIFDTIGVYDYYSRYYFKNPLCPNFTRCKGDYGSFFTLFVTIPMNIVSIIYSYYLLNHVKLTEIEVACKSTREIPLILGLIGISNSILLFITLAFFFIVILSFIITFLLSIIPKTSFKPTVKKEVKKELKKETIPLIVKKDKNTEMMESLASTKIIDWNKEQLGFWLKLQSLGQYESKLSIFPMSVLVDITEHDLSENGVKDIIHQHSIYAAIKSLNFDSTFIYNPYNITTYSSIQIEEFLLKLEIVKPKELIQKHCLNGPLLTGLIDSELQKLLQIPNTSIGNEKMKFISYSINEDPRFYEKKGYYSWDKNQVSKFITSTIELPKYSKIFLQKGIFGCLIPFINSQDCFIELEISPDHYKSFQTAFENIEETILSTSKVYDWCSNLQIIDNESLQNIKLYGIHSAMLLSLDESELTNVFPIIGKNRMKRNAFLLKLDELRSKYKVKNSQRIQIERKGVSVQLGSVPSISLMEKDDRLCQVCQKNPKNVVSLPCNHLFMCESCSLNVGICQICLSNIEQKITVESFE